MQRGGQWVFAKISWIWINGIRKNEKKKNKIVKIALSWEEIISFACKLFPQIYFKSHQNFHKYFCYLLTNKKNTIKFCRYAIQDKLVMDQLNKKKETTEKIP